MADDGVLIEQRLCKADINEKGSTVEDVCPVIEGGTHQKRVLARLCSFPTNKRIKTKLTCDRGHEDDIEKYSCSIDQYRHCDRITNELRRIFLTVLNSATNNSTSPHIIQTSKIESIWESSSTWILTKLSFSIEFLSTYEVQVVSLSLCLSNAKIIWRKHHSL